MVTVKKEVVSVCSGIVIVKLVVVDVVVVVSTSTSEVNVEVTVVCSIVSIVVV